MTNPDALAGVVARVEAYLDTVRAFVKRDDACEMQDEPGYFATLDHADLRTLLAALAEARKDSERLDWLAERYTDYDRWLAAYWADHGFADLRKAIDAARTPTTETPE